MLQELVVTYQTATIDCLSCVPFHEAANPYASQVRVANDDAHAVQVSQPFGPPWPWPRLETGSGSSSSESIPSSPRQRGGCNAGSDSVAS